MPRRVQLVQAVGASVFGAGLLREPGAQKRQPRPRPAQAPQRVHRHLGFCGALPPGVPAETAAARRVPGRGGGRKGAISRDKEALLGL